MGSKDLRGFFFLLYPNWMNGSEKSLLAAQTLDTLIETVTSHARRCFATQAPPNVVVSPYRFNPLGAHVDHQGGAAVARTLNQYSVGAFYPSNSRQITIISTSFGEDTASFALGDELTGANWQRYAMASTLVFEQWARSRGVSVTGMHMVVEGTMVGAGLSSSASIILAYLTALASANNVKLSEKEAVELSRQVENEHMGLNNGVQDQMSVVFGQRNALSQVNVDTVDVDYWRDAPNLQEVQWLVCYSGFSRELISSGFNDRVSECQQAAHLLSPGAKRLGDVPADARTAQAIADLPSELGRRAMHVYTEIQRVADAKRVWEAGGWAEFGRIMNASCASSIEQYECGSEPMHFLQQRALNTQGVYGSRFSGGGYGGCLIMLVDSSLVEAVGESVLSDYLERYPEKAGIATVFVAQAEAAVRVL